MTWMRSGSTRWLAGIAALSAVLVVVSVLVSIFAGDNDELLPADTPEGTVQRYLMAITDEDIPAVYDFISPELKDQCTLEHLLQTTAYQSDRDFSATLSRTTEVGDRTVVTVEITDPGDSSPFGGGRYGYNVSFTLVREDGGWRISEPPWPIGWCPPERPTPVPATPVVATPTPGPTTSISIGKASDEDWRG